MSGVLRPMGPPLEPSADEARRWALEELANNIYNPSEEPGVMSRLWQWFLSVLDALSADGMTAPILLPLLVLAGVGLAVGAAFLLGGPVRRRRLRRKGTSVEVLDDDERGSEVLFAAADAAAASGDFAAAIIERFRGLIRSLDERAILVDRRGRTAYEAASEASAAFVEQAQDLMGASALFDAVCYGDSRPGASDDAWLRDLVKQIERGRPVEPEDRRRSAGWSVAR